MMRIILTRHGHTKANEDRVYNGHNHAPLTIKGLIQARKLGRMLKAQDIAAIYSSDLLRAKRTAMQIAKHHQHLKIIEMRLLRERNFGKYEGVPYDEIDLRNKKARGLESFKQIEKRAKKFLSAIKKKHKDDTIIVVAHGSIDWVIHNILLNIPKAKRKFDPIKNCAISIYKVTAGKPSRLLLKNSCKHLEARKKRRRKGRKK